MNDKVVYKVSSIGSPYEVEIEEGKSLEAVWACERCWFTPGKRVLIEDNHGNHKIFVRGEDDP